MGLHIKRSIGKTSKIILTLTAVFALVAQPMYGFAASYIANATSTQILYVAGGGTDSADCSDIAAPCATIGHAVEQAENGATVEVAAGTYTESLNITKSVTVTGAGRDTTTIKSPTTLAQNSIVRIAGAAVSVHLSDISVAGPATNAYSAGVHVIESATASLKNMNIYDIFRVDSNTYTYGVLIGSTAGGQGTATIDNVSISDYTRGGVYVEGVGSYATVTNSSITGSGPLGSPFPAQNGIVVSHGANATIIGNTIKDNFYSGSGWVASGIILMNGADASTQVHGNTVTGNNMGITNSNGIAAALTNVDITGASGNTWDGYAYHTNTWATPETVYVIQPNLPSTGNIVMHEGKALVKSYNLFTDLQSALNAVAADGVVEVVSDLTTTNQSTIAKAVTINGNGYTVSNARDNSAEDNSNNAILGIQSDDVTVNNLIIDGTDGIWMHGVNVYEAKNVTLNAVTLQNNSNAGMIVGKDSAVTVNGITTLNNGWYGINVDKKAGSSASLTVQGTSEHQEENNAHIFIDDRSVSGNTVSDPGKQYVRYWDGSGYKFVLDREAPTIALSVDAFNPTSFDVHATDDHSVTRVDYSIWKDGARIGIWGNNINLANPYAATVTDYCERVGVTPGNAGTCEFHPISSLDDGVYTLHATIVDVRGKSTNSTPVHFTVDTIAPTATLVATSTNPTLGDEVIVTGSVTDSDIKSHWFEITTPSGVYHEYNMNTTNQNYSFVLDTSYGAGEYRIRYVATDQIGNRNDHVAPSILFINVSAPQLIEEKEDGQTSTDPIVNQNNNSSDTTADENQTPGIVVFTDVLGNVSVLGAQTNDTSDTTTTELLNQANSSEQTPGEVLAAQDENNGNDSWSIINVALAALTVLMSLLLLFGLFGKRENKQVGVRLFSLVPAAGAVVAVVLLENFAGSLSWFNLWTLLFAGVVIVQMIVLSMVKPAPEA